MQASFSSRGFKTKILCAILVPVIFCAIVTNWVAVSSAKHLLEERARQFGGAIADQLAVSITDQLVQRDILGLNVTLGNLQAKGDFSFASVYGADNKLLAQTGKSNGDQLVFTRDVVFQNATAGYLQIGLAHQYVDSPATTILLTSILVHLILVSLIGLFGWSYADLVYLWLTAPRRREPEPMIEQPAPEEHPDEGESNRLTILVIKVRPARLVAMHRKMITQALALYGGDVEATDGGDFTVTFRSRSQIFDAMRSALLVRALMQLGHDAATVKLGLHTTAETGQADKARKQATYMASISDNVLLASKEVHRCLDRPEQVTMHQFHSSLTPSGEVYYVDSLGGQNQELIQRQARQLLGR
jgi:uncharacterized membrane protein affecting hemolysin expression